MKKLKYNGIWLMAMMFIIFTIVSILHWYAFGGGNNPPKNWISTSWNGYLSSLVVLIFSGWFAYQAYYKGGRLFWILQIILTALNIGFKSGFLNEHAYMIACIRYTSQAILWGSAFFLCAVHGASIFVIRKKMQKSGKGECLAPPPHTTGHAGSHPAVRKAPSDN